MTIADTIERLEDAEAENAALVEALRLYCIEPMDDEMGCAFCGSCYTPSPSVSWKHLEHKPDCIVANPTSAGAALLKRLEDAERLVVQFALSLEQYEELYGDAESFTQFKDEIERLRQNQRTVGTVEVCAECEAPRAEECAYDIEYCAFVGNCPPSWNTKDNEAKAMRSQEKK
jgi:hypothetical protein